jgi:hypothetical protein
MYDPNLIDNIDRVPILIENRPGNDWITASTATSCCTPAPQRVRNTFHMSTTMRLHALSRCQAVMGMPRGTHTHT